MGQYYRDHRRHPRTGVQWPAEVQAPGEEARFTFVAADVSAGGLCLRGDAPVAFTMRRTPAGEMRFALRLVLPGGRMVGGIEAVQVWETRHEGQVLSGWRFVGMPVAAWRTLQEEVGLGPAEVGQPVYDRWDEDEIELWDYIQVLVRRRWTVIGCTLLTGLLAFGYARSRPALFTATAQILPMGEVDYLSRREGLEYGGLSTTPYIAILESYPLNRSIARRQYTVSRPDTAVRQTLVEYVHERAGRPGKPVELSEAEWQRRLEARAVAWLGERARLKQGKADRVIQIECSASDPGVAAEVANAYVEELREHLLRSSRGFTDQNLEMARYRMDTLVRELAKAAQELEVFRTANQGLLRDSLGVELQYPEVATRYGQLSRSLSLKQSLYNTVANQFELLRLQRSKSASGVEVIAEAETPLGVTNTAYVKSIVLGCMAGLFAGVFLAFVQEYVGRKRTTGELAALGEAWQQDRARLRRLRPW